MAARSHGSPVVDTLRVRRLALARAGLLKPEWTGYPTRAGRTQAELHDTANAIIRGTGYLQLDTVSIAGARSHALVLLSRLAGFPAALGEELLRPEASLFEYWGHEACWLPIESYPLFAFRRKRFRHHPWWGDIIGSHRALSRDILKRIRDEGPVMSSDLEGADRGGWWNHKPAKRVLAALWTSGELAIRERSGFRRTFDLVERVIPEVHRNAAVSEPAAVETLLLQALNGHGWAQTRTLGATWRFTGMSVQVRAALTRLEHQGRIVPCVHRLSDGTHQTGWIRPEDLELAERLATLSVRSSSGVLLSPFDPVLWDRRRVADLFGFDQVLEIFKPAAQRIYGYYCLPVLSGERLIARVDLKCERKSGTLRVLSRRFEHSGSARPPSTAEALRVERALARYAGQIGLAVR